MKLERKKFKKNFTIYKNNFDTIHFDTDQEHNHMLYCLEKALVVYICVYTYDYDINFFI